MAQIHNALSRATELIRGYRRALGIVDPAAGVERLGETVTPVVDLWRNPEWAALRSDRLLWGYESVAAGGAGTRSQVQLLHDDPNSVCVVEYAMAATDCLLRLQFGATALANLSGQFGARDTRLSGWSGTRLFYGAPAAATGALRWFPRAAQVVPVNLVIHATATAATAVVLEPGTDNTAITGGFIYRVHPLFPGEGIV